MSHPLLQSTVQLARAVFGAKAASILLHDPQAGELWFAAATGEGDESIRGMRIPADSGIAGWVLAARQPIIVEDVVQDPRFSDRVARQSGFQPKGLMAAPLLSEDEEVLGVLEVLDRPRRAQFSLIELDLLGLLAEQAATILEAEREAGRERGELPDAVRRVGDVLLDADPERRERAETMLDALCDLLRAGG